MRTTRQVRAGGRVALVVLLAACGPTAEPPAARSVRVLLVGVDGLDWSVALPLIRDGRMPHLESLMRHGVSGKLETLAPAKSPVIWTSIATGRLPEQHGIVDFTGTGANGRRRLLTSADRRTKALWNILADAGRRSIIVSWWNTFPAEPIDGVVVAQANTLEQMARRRMLKPGGMMRGVEGQVYPAARQDEMLEFAERIDEAMPGVVESIFGDIGRGETLAERANLDSCTWSVRADESTRRIALKLAAEPELPDLFAVYFGMPDVVSHRFWRFHEPEAFDHPPTAEAVERFGRVVVDAYIHADSAIGELVAALTENTTVFVVSDHGMHAKNRSARFDVAVRGRLERESGGHDDGPPGLLVAAGPGIRRVGISGSVAGLTVEDLPVVGHALDVTPTLLALLGLPVGRDMDGRVLEPLLDPGPSVRFVDTHDTPAWLASRGGSAPEPPGTEERLEQLRSLGYIGGGDEEDR